MWLKFFNFFFFFCLRLGVHTFLCVFEGARVCTGFFARPEFCRSVAVDSGSKPVSKADMISGPTAARAAS